MRRIIFIAIAVFMFFSIKAQVNEGWIKLMDENMQPLYNVALIYVDSSKIQDIEYVNNGFYANDAIQYDKIIITKHAKTTVELYKNDLKSTKEIVLRNLLSNEVATLEIEAENVAYIDSLPKDYKIMEVKSMSEKKYRTSGLNVRKSVEEREFINEEKVKEGFRVDSEVLNSKNYIRGNKIYYGVGSAILLDDVKQELKTIANALNGSQNIELKLTAYADANEEQNEAKQIAKQRVERLTSFFMEAGVPFNKIRPVAVGNDVLANGCYKNIDCTFKQHQENRSVEILLLEK
ncbi:MAG: OmpA family protein [Chitinophagales bacterium]|nr:OmpA family protein [Chitinophagales bacterium]